MFTCTAVVVFLIAEGTDPLYYNWTIHCLHAYGHLHLTIATKTQSQVTTNNNMWSEYPSKMTVEQKNKIIVFHFAIPNLSNWHLNQKSNIVKRFSHFTLLQKCSFHELKSLCVRLESWKLALTSGFSHVANWTITDNNLSNLFMLDHIAKLSEES